jgi:hypothetical protein
MFRSHEDGSKKLNACSLCIFCMVYFNLNTESYYLQIIYYSIYPLDNASLNPPFTPFHPYFYLLGELASLLVVRIPIHSCPWSANNCPTLC